MCNSEKICANTNCCSLGTDMKESDNSSSPRNKKNNTDSDDCCCQMENVRSVANKSCCASSRINDSSGGGVLRFALHLRFLCPASKKSSKSMLRCKSDPSSVPHGGNALTEDRRFYLYNDLRVVFPQRHSDSDEGEVCTHLKVFYWLSFFWFLSSRSSTKVCGSAYTEIIALLFPGQLNS
jgi:hypothetical protein